MSQFCARWELQTSSQDFENYMQAVCVSPEKIEQAKQSLCAGAKVVQEISRDGNVWKVSVITQAGTKVDEYPEGSEASVTTLDGRKVKVVYSLEGDTLVENQTGDGFTSRNVRTVGGDTLTMTFTANGGKASCTRTYKRLA